MAPPPQALWVRGALTYAIYTVAGLLSLLVATQGEGVSQLYIAAGFGLALVLAWGAPMALAVGLGSATVSLVGDLWLRQIHLTWPEGLLVLVSGLGGGLQAWLAAKWIQGPDGQRDLPLDSIRQVARFLLLAGPVACLINASLSGWSMVALGVLAPAQWLQFVGGWWAGDTLGVLMGTPMLLTLVGSPSKLWRQRRLVVGVPLLVATVLLGLGISLIQSWESQRESAEFRQQAQATANAVRLRLNGYLTAIEAVRSVYDASDSVERDEFRRATTPWLVQLQGIQGIGWEERLPLGRLPEFEAAQRAEGLPNYRVFDWPDRKPPKGPEVVALRFIEPLLGNERALGLNILSREVSHQAYQRAVRENVAVATPGFKLTQEVGQQLGVVVYRAVYRTPPQSAQEQDTSTTGVVFMALRMDDALAAVLKGMPSYLRACLLDVSPPQPTLLSGSPHCRANSPTDVRQTLTVELPFGGRQWALRLWTTEPVPISGGQAASWVFAIGGVAFAAALGALLLVITGTTERMAAAIDEARQQRAAAESANRAKNDFLSRMSHELRTPLNAMLGFAQVMGIDTLNPLNKVQQNRVDQIQQAGWHLLDMIDDVLDLSRIDSDTPNLHAERLALPEVLEAARHMVQSQAQHQQIALDIEVNIPSGWGVQADDTRLRQVLTSLMSNGVKYNKPGGRVHVQAAMLRPAGGLPVMQIVVADTGIGMSPAQLGQLFQPFNRLGRERLSPDGTGIGLVISRHLVQLMGGTLEVSSEEGHGSTFTVTLRAVALDVAPPPPLARPSHAVASTPTARPSVRHVLYVEDNAANTAVIEAALSSRPEIQLSLAATIEEGLARVHDRLQGQVPELILLDVHLPDASGLDFLKLVKANPATSRIPVIMISADATPEQIDASLKAGAACYLTKPLQISALLQQIDELLVRPAAPGA
jgi:signal transduction histidine kinase/ActR/RegA family two-component response regulator/sensor domain CHASE-containing protein